MPTVETHLHGQGILDNSIEEPIKSETLRLNNLSLTEQRDFIHKSALRKNVSPLRDVSKDSTGNVFLTGVTGFLGAFFLSELIKRTAHSVICLVRAANREQARDRILSTLDFYHLHDALKESTRIVPLLGDLRRPRFGLSDGDFISIGQSIDRVYHLGADVNMILPYNAVKAANVQGTIEVIQLACVRPSTSLHFVSTVGVFLSPAYAGGIAYEDEFSLTMDGLGNGYSQSKWVAEKLVRQASNRGLHTCIYRPTFIGWDSNTGAYNRNDFISALLCIALATGHAPNLDMAINIVPVDQVCRAILHISNASSNNKGLAYHISNNNPTTWIKVVQVCNEASFPIILEGYRDWRERIASSSIRHRFSRFLSMLPTLTKSGATVNADRLSPSFYPKFDCRQTLDGLKETEIDFPCLEASLLAPHLNYLLREISTSEKRTVRIAQADPPE